MFYVLKFSKENCFTLPFYCTVLCAGRSAKEDLNHLLHTAFLRKNQETSQILLFSPMLLNLVKNVSCFLFIALPCVQSALNHLIHCVRLTKKLGHITNINIWSYNLKFSEKTVLYFHFTALCYVQGVRKKLNPFLPNVPF